MSQQAKGDSSKNLGLYLASMRKANKLTLRQVEEATNREVSNAYLSQLENGKVAKPSPNILYSLANIYDVSYNLLMERAGYIVARENLKATGKHGRVATYSIDNLTPEEETELLDYLNYIRSKKNRHAKT